MAANTVWVGIGAFGSSQIAKRFDGALEASDFETVEISELNQATLDGFADQTVAAIGIVLEYANQDPLHQVEQVVPSVWVIIDAEDASFTFLIGWLEKCFDQLSRQQVRIRLQLVVRDRSWGMPEDVRSAFAANVRTFVERLCAPSKIGHGATTIIVVPDRNPTSGRFPVEVVDATISRLIDLVIDEGFGERDLGMAFANASGSMGDDWAELPIFGAISTRALEWIEPGRSRSEHAEARRSRLVEALDEPVPESYSPDPAPVQSLDYRDLVSWPELGIPDWSPQFWRSAQDQQAEVSERIDKWLVRAEKQWRPSMCTEYFDSQNRIALHQEAAQARYLEDLNSRVASILDDAHARGLFRPIQRLLDRSQAAIVTQSRLLEPIPLAESIDEGTFDPVEATVLPSQALKGADRDLNRRLSRRVNSNAFAIVALMVWGLLVSWTIYAAIQIRDWQQPSSALSPQGQIKGWILDRVSGWIPGWLDVLPPMPVVIGLAVVGWGIIVGLTSLTIILRQRYVLERAWQTVHVRARRWRSQTKDLLEQQLIAEERRANHALIEHCLVDVQSRRNRMEHLRARSQEPVFPMVISDPSVNEHYPAHASAPTPLSNIQIGQILQEFRHNLRTDPGFEEKPDVVLAQLMDTAARIAGDPRLDLTQRLESDATFQEAVARVLPDSRSVHLQPRDPNVSFTDMGHTRRFLAGPSAAYDALRRISDGLTTIRTIPSQTRFYGLTLHAELDARRVLGAYALTSADPSPAQQSPYPEAQEGELGDKSASDSSGDNVETDQIHCAEQVEGINEPISSDREE